MQRSLLLAVLVLTAGSVATVWWVTSPSRTDAAGPPATTMRPPTAQTDPTSPVRILTEWDERRAAAWAAGEPGALRALYVAGSESGREDVRRLKKYLDRGLRVEGLSMQVLSVSVVQQGSRAMELEVTDRVAGGVAVGEAGRFALPQGRPETRSVRFVLSHGSWLVEDVRTTGRRPARR